MMYVKIEYEKVLCARKWNGMYARERRINCLHVGTCTCTCTCIVTVGMQACGDVMTVHEAIPRARIMVGQKAILTSLLILSSARNNS